MSRRPRGLRWYAARLPRRRARGLGIREGRSGSLTVIQRFGSALNLNVHFHTLVLDGVFTSAAPDTVRFHPTPPPTDAEVARLLTVIRRRVLRLLGRRGLGHEADAPQPVGEDSPALAALTSASIEGRVALGARAGRRVVALGRERTL